MGVKFTKEQQQVIDLRNCNILVSAAAGSGKTAVLVERIITRLTKDEKPLDVDELLIVTYTEAAAAEMKERIHAAIERALEEKPEDAHLQRQSTLIHQAQIMTIHKFCLSVMRDYFHVIDLDPGFRVGEEGEMRLLKRDVIEKVLEEAYQEGTDSFLRFVESFAFGKNDNKLEDLILQMFEFSRSYPNPDKWLDSCVKNYEIHSVEELETYPFMKKIRNEIFLQLSDMKELLEHGVELCRSENGPTVYENALVSDLNHIEEVLHANSFTEMQEIFSQIVWMKLASNRDKTVDEKKIELVKQIRDDEKNLVKQIMETYFFSPIIDMQKELLTSGENMQVLVNLTKRFECAFAEEKRRKNIIDFSDMEQFALKILTEEQDEEYLPSIAAESYQQKFAEVMIDEYQDSNLVQEAILTSVSRVSKGEYNIFMVGDVKQSIYRFRLSRPELFMEKFHTYRIGEGEKQRIDLHKNFRSRREVLDSTNYIFRQIMRSDFGGIEYDDQAALYVGAEYEAREGNETEVLILEAKDSNASERVELEAEVVANRIQELMRTQEVFDKHTEAYRKLRYSDIVILSRSMKGWSDVFARVLKNAGIPTYTGSKEGYFQTQEIQLILNYLKILDNPLQDIPFTSVLVSMFVKLTSEELAIICSEAKGKKIYDKICNYAECGENDTIKTRLKQFLSTYMKIRDCVPYMSIHELLEKILAETGYDDYIAALPAGEQRVANLEMLIEKAVTFEGTSYKGLFHFIRYIDQLQKYDVDYGEASLMDEKMDVVCLMSIHKSKGLEFPVVFVTGLGKQFNMQDVRSSIVVHPELGIGIDAIDPILRVKNPTILKKVIQRSVQKESTAEELRVLYVAMTRAKEKMILTGSVTDLEKRLMMHAALEKRRELKLPYYTLTKANSYIDWILPAIIRNQCEELIRVQVISHEDLVGHEVEQVYRDVVTKQILDEWDTETVYNADAKERILAQLLYEYPYSDGQPVKQKLSVSELKQNIYREEEGESLFEEEEVIPLMPRFLKEEESLSGASRGSAYHKVLELLDFEREYDEESLTRTIAELQERNLLSEQMASCIRINDILQFLRSDIAKRMKRAAVAGQCYAEQPFVVGLNADQVYPDNQNDEVVLIQGIIDVYFEENEELVVVDYKTDRVKEVKELVDKYHVQLEYYAKALEQLTEKRVKEKIIYSFALHKQIEVET